MSKPLDLDPIEARIPAVYNGPWSYQWDDSEAGRYDCWAISYPTDNPLAGLVAEVPDYGAEIAEFIAHAREDVPALIAEVRRLRAVASATSVETETDEQRADRGLIVREAISHLRNVNISCTALTGPVWYGTGWNEAITHLEEVADQMSDEGQPKRELITVDAFARALHDAQVWFHKGDFPEWDELSTAPGRGKDEVRMVARWLLKRLFVTEREAKEAGRG